MGSECNPAPVGKIVILGESGELYVWIFQLPTYVWVDDPQLSKYTRHGFVAPTFVLNTQHTNK
jgi:hypothetical protein